MYINIMFLIYKIIIDPVYWVSIDMLWDAVNTIDGETGESR